MILVTGGAGYIGSHTCVELLNGGYDVIIADNFANSSLAVIENIRKITGKDILVYQIDLLDQTALAKIFQENQIDAVIHFAGLKAVGESMVQPLDYYSVNLITTLNLCNVMSEFNVKRLVFSSTAAVYGNPQTVPIKEDFPLAATSPYGSTKLMIEQILGDLSQADPEWSIALLRYFNPIGAHPSGLIGENPHGLPNNLFPYLAKVVSGELAYLRVFGNDYPTKDGTGVRDYIHVADLGTGHIKALEKVLQTSGIDVYNLGTGKGFSVLELIHAFEKVTGEQVTYKITARRPGDIAICYADTQKAKQQLGWQATRTIEEMCQDAWNFSTKRRPI